MLKDLFRMVSGELKSSLASLMETALKVCVSTQQIYSVVLEIRGSLAVADTRWTFFQAPLIVEDVLGLKFPVPSEYDFDLLDTIIRHRFRRGEGSLDVKAGNYELSNTKNSKEILSPTVRLLPGMEIRMAILVLSVTSSNEMCPMPCCGSVLTSPVPGGGWPYSECGLWFDHASKKLRELPYLLDVIEIFPAEESSEPQFGMHQQDKVNFRNVRCAIEEVPYDTWKNDFDFSSYGTDENPETGDTLRSGGEFPVLSDAFGFVDQVKVIDSQRPEFCDSYLDDIYDTPTLIRPMSIAFADTPPLIRPMSIAFADTPPLSCPMSIPFADTPTLLSEFDTFLPSGDQKYCASEELPAASGWYPSYFTGWYDRAYLQLPKSGWIGVEDQPLF